MSFPRRTTRRWPAWSPSSWSAPVNQHHVRIRAVGVGARPGPIARDLETVSPVNIPAWRGFPLQGATPGHHPAARVRRSRRQGACARRGVARRRPRDIQNFCALTVSTGVGGGVDPRRRVARWRDRQRRPHRPRHRGTLGDGAADAVPRAASRPRPPAWPSKRSPARPPTEPTYEIMQRTGHPRRASRLRRSAMPSTCRSSWSAAASRSASRRPSSIQPRSRSTITRSSPYSRGARITPSRLADSGPADRRRSSRVARPSALPTQCRR